MKVSKVTTEVENHNASKNKFWHLTIPSICKIYMLILHLRNLYVLSFLKIKKRILKLDTSILSYMDNIWFYSKANQFR